MKTETIAIHAGNHVDETTGGVIQPIVLSTTFERKVDGSFREGYIYSRSANPNRTSLEKVLAKLEGGADAAAFSSGNAAGMAVFQSLQPGTHIIAPDDMYHGLRNQLKTLFAGILEFDFINIDNTEVLNAHIMAAGGLPDWVGAAALVVLGVALLVVFGLLVWALLRDQSKRRARKAGRRTAQRRDQPNTAEDLIDALDAGLEELSDADRDPRRAVIACWVRLEQSAAAAGTPRHPGDTPTDLVGRLLAEQQVDSQVLAALLEVYRQARYATHTVDDQMRRQARSALQRLRTDLGAGVAG